VIYYLTQTQTKLLKLTNIILLTKQVDKWVSFHYSNCYFFRYVFTFRGPS